MACRGSAVRVRLAPSREPRLCLGFSVSEAPEAGKDRPACGRRVRGPDQQRSQHKPQPSSPIHHASRRILVHGVQQAEACVRHRTARPRWFQARAMPGTGGPKPSRCLCSRLLLTNDAHQRRVERLLRQAPEIARRRHHPGVLLKVGRRRPCRFFLLRAHHHHHRDDGAADGVAQNRFDSWQQAGRISLKGDHDDRDHLVCLHPDSRSIKGNLLSRNGPPTDDASITKVELHLRIDRQTSSGMADVEQVGLQQIATTASQNDHLGHLITKGVSLLRPPIPRRLTPVAGLLQTLDPTQATAMRRRFHTPPCFSRVYTDREGAGMTMQTLNHCLSF